MKKTNAMRILDATHINYKEYTYDVDKRGDMKIEDILKQPANKIYKTLVTQGKSKEHYVFVLPITHELDLKKAAKAVNEKSIEMIPMKNLLPTTGYIHGGCSPVGMKKQFETVIDVSAKDNETIIVSGGKIGFHIELSANDLIEVIHSKYMDIVV